MNVRGGSPYVRGAIYGLAAVCIWASFIVVSRLGVTTSMTPWDVAAIRFTVAGLLLLPYLVRKGIGLDKLGWTGVGAVVAGCGAPMVLLVNAGLLFAPAAHGGALFPGVMPLMVAILAAIVLKERFSVRKWIGLAAIVTGAVGIVWGAAVPWARHRPSGTRCSSSQVSRGPPTPWPCGERVSTVFMPPLSQREDRWRSIFPLTRSSREPLSSKHPCSTLHCRPSFRAF